MIFRLLFLSSLFLGSATTVYSQDADSLRYKVGQMLICGFNGTTLDVNTAVTLSRNFVGGVILFEKSLSNNSGDRNIKDPDQLKQLITSLKDVSIGNLLVAIDQEGGSVSRLSPKRGFLPTKSARYLGDLDNADTTSFFAHQQARQLRDLGINLNFAPCVDLAINKDNDVIVKRGRAFGDHALPVGRHAGAFIQAHHIEGVLTCLKHFPGHGSSKGDSHYGIVDITDTFEDRELKPYYDIVKDGYNDVIMVGHLINRKYDTLPASLSKVVIDSILRKQIGYQGVVATDDLNMGAISNHFEYKDALKKAINAGVDMLVVGNNGSTYRSRLIEVTIVHILDLVNSGEISKDRINQAYRRIKSLKDRVE